MQQLSGATTTTAAITADSIARESHWLQPRPDWQSETRTGSTSASEVATAEWQQCGRGTKTNWPAPLPPTIRYHRPAFCPPFTPAPHTASLSMHHTVHHVNSNKRPPTQTVQVRPTEEQRKMRKESRLSGRKCHCQLPSDALRRPYTTLQPADVQSHHNNPHCSFR